MFKTKSTSEHVFICAIISIICLVFGSVQGENIAGGDKFVSELLLDTDTLLKDINSNIPLVSSDCGNNLERSPLLSVKSNAHLSIENSTPSQSEGQIVSEKHTEQSSETKKLVESGKTSSTAGKFNENRYRDMYIKHLTELKKSGKAYKQRIKYLDLSGDKLTYLQKNPPITGSILPDEPKVVKRIARPSFVPEIPRHKVGINVESDPQELLNILDEQNKKLEELQMLYNRLMDASSSYNIVIERLRTQLEHSRALTDPYKRVQIQPAGSGAGVPSIPTVPEHDTYNIEEKVLIGKIEKLIGRRAAIFKAKKGIELVKKHHADIKKSIETGKKVSISSVFLHLEDLERMREICSIIERQSTGHICEGGEHKLDETDSFPLRETAPASFKYVSSIYRYIDPMSPYDQPTASYSHSRACFKPAAPSPSGERMVSRWSGRIRGTTHSKLRLTEHTTGQSQDLDTGGSPSMKDDLYVARRIFIDDDDDDDIEIMYNKLCEEARILENDIGQSDTEYRRKIKGIFKGLHMLAYELNKKKIISESEKKSLLLNKIDRFERKNKYLRRCLDDICIIAGRSSCYGDEQPVTLPSPCRDEIKDKVSADNENNESTGLVKHSTLVSVIPPEPIDSETKRQQLNSLNNEISAIRSKLS